MCRSVSLRVCLRMALGDAYRRLRADVENPHGQPLRFNLDEAARYPGLNYLPNRYRSPRVRVLLWLVRLGLAVPTVIWLVVPDYRRHGLFALWPAAWVAILAVAHRRQASRDADRWKQDHPGRDLPPPVRG